MSAWKNRLVLLTMIFLGVSFLIFLVSGYTAFYRAWAPANFESARPYLPWSFCSLKISFPNPCTVLIFFTAGLLFLCFEHVDDWERIASRGDRPSHPI